MELQTEQLERLGQQLPLPQIRLPFEFTADVGPVELDELAAAMTAGIQDLVAL